MAFITAESEIPKLEDMDQIQDLPANSKIATYQGEVFVIGPGGPTHRIIDSRLVPVEQYGG